MALSIHVGCQGWRYADWRAQAEDAGPWSAPFYAPHTRADQELSQYSHTFDLVEVDSTFYAIPPESTVKHWAEQTPASFRFTLKLPRTLTHEDRLRRGRKTLQEFCERARWLGPKLAAVLIQLPPSFSPQEFPVLERFLPHLPQDLSFAIEFRDKAWLNAKTVALLQQNQVALTLGETPWISTEVSLAWSQKLPTDWLYIRMMGLKKGGIERFTHLQVNRDRELTVWAATLQDLAAQEKRVYVLMDNHFQGFSPGSATLIKEKLGQTLQPFPREQMHPADQLRLELQP
jgi:uncharacterized protein YecE (DUF72 family)